MPRLIQEEKKRHDLDANIGHLLAEFKSKVARFDLLRSPVANPANYAPGGTGDCADDSRHRADVERQRVEHLMQVVP